MWPPCQLFKTSCYDNNDDDDEDVDDHGGDDDLSNCMAMLID